MGGWVSDAALVWAGCGCSGGWLSALAGVALALLSTWAHLAFWRRKLSTPISYDETHTVSVAPGSYCELRRLRPPVASALPPVVMVHGIAINHRNLDPRPDVSLARAVRDAGRDVWLLTLRSGRWDLSAGERKAIDFAALAHEDLPKALAFVRAQTGADQLDYLGFSMGGMLLYACIGQTVPEAALRRVVIMGSPGIVGAVLPGTRLVAAIGRVWQPTLHARFWTGLTAFLAEMVPTHIHGIFLNRRNCLPGLIHTYMVDATSDIPGPLGMNMVHWAARDGVVRLDGEPVLPRLAAVRVPALFMAGAADKLGTVRAVRAAYDVWGGAKELRVLGRSAGCVADYGHMDMVTGPAAPREVFAPIIAFLAEPA